MSTKISRVAKQFGLFFLMNTWLGHTHTTFTKNRPNCSMFGIIFFSNAVLWWRTSYYGANIVGPRIYARNAASHYRFLAFIRDDSLARVVKRDARQQSSVSLNFVGFDARNQRDYTVLHAKQWRIWSSAISNQIFAKVTSIDSLQFYI